MKKIGVGVIASPIDPGWAALAHISAIHALPEFELRAVSAGLVASVAGSDDAGAYDNGLDLIADPGVGLVVVAANAPNRPALISAAIDAGKMVFSEWPLGSDLQEASELAEQALSAGVRTAIGLRARYAPAVHHARDLVRRGFVGEVLGTTLVGSAMASGADADRFDPAHGATTLSAPMMQALDALTCVLGDFDTVTATCGVRGSPVRIVDRDQSSPLMAADHIALSGRLRSGAIVSAFYRSEFSRGDNLRWEINGTDGDLVLTASNGNMQVAHLELEGGCGNETSVHPLEIPPAFNRSAGGLSGELGANVMREYAALARDLRHGTRLVPGFEYALSRHVLLAAIETAARSGVTQQFIER